VRRLVEKHRDVPLAAICTAVPSIRYALKDIRVSFFPLVEARSLLNDAGAVLTTLSLCVDKNVVTAENQSRAKEWAIHFCDLLEGKKTEFHLIDSGFVPKGRPRRLPPELERLQ
jgi:putative intracellular protease/amidase